MRTLFVWTVLFSLDFASFTPSYSESSDSIYDRDRGGRNVLIDYCHHGAYESALQHIKHGKADVNVQDSDGQTPLMYVMSVSFGYHKEHEKLKEHLWENSDLTLKNNEGLDILDMYDVSLSEFTSAISGALKRNDLGSMARILEYEDGLDFDFVAQVRSYEMMLLLYQHDKHRVRQSINAISDDTTVLHCAIQKQNFELVEFLVQRCIADVTLVDRLFGKSAITLAMTVILYSRSGTLENATANEVFELLIQSIDGADFKRVIRNESFSSHFKRAVELNLISGCNQEFCQRIMYKVSRPSLRSLKKELEAHPKLRKSLERLGLDTDFLNGYDSEAMRNALIKALQSGCHQELHFFLAYKTPLEGVIKHISDSEQARIFVQRLGLATFQFWVYQDRPNLMVIAAMAGNLPLLRTLLLRAFIDPNVTDDSQRTCLVALLESLAHGQIPEADAMVQLLAPYTDTSIPNNSGLAVVDLLNERKIYKKLSKASAQMIENQRYRRHLSAFELTKLAQLNK